MPKTREEKNEYARQYYQSHREKIIAQRKVYVETHKEACDEYMIQYRINNKEEMKERRKIRNKTEKGKKSVKITTWKGRGLLGDYEMIYKIYQSTKFCDDCAFELETGDTRYVKCMDHSHVTGEFRGVVCKGCNNRRG